MSIENDVLLDDYRSACSDGKTGRSGAEAGLRLSNRKRPVRHRPRGVGVRDEDMARTGVEAADHGAPTTETTAVEDLARPWGRATDMKGTVGAPRRAGTRDRRRTVTATPYRGGAGDIVDDGAPIDDRERAVPPVTDDQFVAVRPRRAGPGDRRRAARAGQDTDDVGGTCAAA